MTGYILSPDAEDDIFEIWSYLAKEVGIGFANQVESALFNDFALLVKSPGLGHNRQDLTKIPVLFFRAFPYRYMVVYRAKTTLEIVAVLHANRDVKLILEGRKKS